MAVCFLEPEHRAPGLRRGVVEGSARNVRDPQGSHELQARQTLGLLLAPLAERRVLQKLPHQCVLDDRIAELVDDRGDREDPAQPLVQTRLCHRLRTSWPRSGNISMTSARYV